MAPRDDQAGKETVRILELIQNELHASRIGQARPFHLEEWAETDVALGQTVIASRPTSANVIEVHSIIVVTAAPATKATLKLGYRTYPLPVGVATLSGLLIQLRPDDERSLTVDAACTARLHLMGEEIVGAPGVSMGRN